jgi:hypothetical protein
MACLNMIAGGRCEYLRILNSFIECEKNKCPYETEEHAVENCDNYEYEPDEFDDYIYYE